jgi:hypothetical protein
VENLPLALFERFADDIVALPERDEFSKADLLIPKFRLVKDNSLEIYYAPFDFINTYAKVAVVGITPGWTQMEIAFRQARAALRGGLSAIETLRRAKVDASFAGTMRKNLVKMLDEAGLSKRLKLDTCERLFGDARHLLHTTSVVRYPAFVNGRNYSGHSPEMLRTPELCRFVDEVLPAEFRVMPDALIIPLGKCVDTVLKHLIHTGVLDARRCLLGFPHPSGANGHRKTEFEQGLKQFTQGVDGWFR